MKYAIYGSLGVALTVFAATAQADLAPKKPSDVVTLELGAGGCGGNSIVRFFDTRVLSDGTSVPFVVPTGMVLMLTEWEFYAVSGGSTGPGAAESELRIGDGTSASNTVALAVLAPDAAGVQIGSTRQSFQPGIVVTSGKLPCVFGLNYNVFFAHVNRVRGFLTKKK